MHKFVELLTVTCAKYVYICTGYIFNNVAVNKAAYFYTICARILHTFLPLKNSTFTSFVAEYYGLLPTHYNNYYIK